MRQSRYPLEVVRTQREQAYKHAEFEMVSARGKLFEAEQALKAAQEACKAHASKRSRLVTPEPAEASQLMSATRLSWSGAYSARLLAEARKLALLAQAEQTHVAAQARALRLAELAWHRAYAEREALERHHERFREAERKAAERAYELESEDQAHQATLRMRS
jgi:hypothetical protein